MSARCDSRRAWLALVVLVAACQAPRAPPVEEPVTPPAPPDCEGGRLAGDGPNQCFFPNPSEKCVAGTMPLLGTSLCTRVGWSTCAPPFRRDASGWGCHEILEGFPCAPGTMPQLGAESCVPVGPTCAPGFVTDPSGYGCRDVLPAVPCSGATRDALGSTDCAPVGDCSAPFPPPAATLFVDAAGVVDGTHFRAISDALAVAMDGDWVAVAPGTYRESLRAKRSITLAGRCAGQVILEGDGTTTGFVFAGALKGTLSGFTLRRHGVGVAVGLGATLAVSDLIVERSTGAGLLSLGKGAALTARRTVVRDTLVAADHSGGYGGVASGGRLELDEVAIVGGRAGLVTDAAGSQLVARHTVIRGARTPAGELPGSGLLALGGTSLLEESAAVGCDDAAVIVSGAGVELKVVRSVLRGGPATTGRRGALGAQADSGARLTLEDCTVADSLRVGITIAGKGGSAAVLRTAVLDTTTPDDKLGDGIIVQEDASLEVRATSVVGSVEAGIMVLGAGATAVVAGSLVRDTRKVKAGRLGVGVAVMFGGRLTMSASSMLSNIEAGFFLHGPGSSATASGLIVAGTRRSIYDVDEQVAGVEVRNGASLELTSSAVLDNQEIGLHVGEVQEGQHPVARVDGLTLRATLRSTSTGSGNGAGISVDDGGRLELSHASISGNISAGLVVDGRGASAKLSEVAVRDGRPNNDRQFGRGLVVQGGGALSVDSVAVVENREISVFVAGEGSTLTGQSLLIADTAVDGAGGSGQGLQVVDAVVTLKGGALLRNRDAAAMVSGSGALLRLDQVLIAEVAEEQSSHRIGDGIVTQDEARLELADSLIRRVSGVGLFFANGGGSVSRCEIDDSPAAFHTQLGSRLLLEAPATPLVGDVLVDDQTQMRRNATRVGTGTLPLPRLHDGVKVH